MKREHEQGLADTQHDKNITRAIAREGEGLRGGRGGCVAHVSEVADRAEPVAGVVRLPLGPGRERGVVVEACGVRNSKSAHQLIQNA